MGLRYLPAVQSCFAFIVELIPPAFVYSGFAKFPMAFSVSQLLQVGPVDPSFSLYAFS